MAGLGRDVTHSSVGDEAGTSSSTGPPSWWGAQNLRDNFGAAVLWVSTQHTRTPLHADDQPQFLVQLHGSKHVTLFPHIRTPKDSRNLIRLAWAQG